MFKAPAQPWLHSCKVDSVFVLMPAFVSVIMAVFLKNASFLQTHGSWFWLFCVVGIDAAHVYATLFRTYWDKSDFRKHETILLVIPLLCLGGGIMLYSWGSLVFWRVLAYIAVFHFIRQQYGFYRLYKRFETETLFEYYLGKCTLYMATLYPILDWHLGSRQNISWFVAGDFFFFDLPTLRVFLKLLYWMTMVVWLWMQIISFIKMRKINIPGCMIVIGTALSWYVGIVLYDNDVVFTLTNVMTHGIPYVALVWIFNCQKARQDQVQTVSVFSRWKIFFTRSGVVLFVAILFGLAFIEEGFWDVFIWREHGIFYSSLSALFDEAGEKMRLWLVPLLSLPQTAHYFIDGFIWKKEHLDLSLKA